MALFTIWAFNYIIPDTEISLMDALIAAAIVAVSEWIFHEYVRGAVFRPVEGK